MSNLDESFPPKAVNLTHSDSVILQCFLLSYFENRDYRHVVDMFINHRLITNLDILLYCKCPLYLFMYLQALEEVTQTNRHRNITTACAFFFFCCCCCCCCCCFVLFQHAAAPRQGPVQLHQPQVDLLCLVSALRQTMHWRDVPTIVWLFWPTPP